MTIQERIDQVAGMVKEGLNEGLTQEAKDAIMDAVKDLGFQWQHSNASAKATLAIVGMTQHEDDEMFDINNMEQLHQLEAEGSIMILREVGLRLYSDMTLLFLHEALGTIKEE